MDASTDIDMWYVQYCETVPAVISCGKDGFK